MLVFALIIAVVLALLATVEVVAEALANLFVGETDNNRFPVKGNNVSSETVQEEIPVEVIPAPVLITGMGLVASPFSAIFGRVFDGTYREVGQSTQLIEYKEESPMDIQNTQTQTTAVKAVIMKAAHQVAKTMPSSEGTYSQRLGKALKLVWAWAKAQPTQDVVSMDMEVIISGVLPAPATLKPRTLKTSSYDAFIEKVKELEQGAWYYSLYESHIAKDISQWPALQQLKAEMLSGSYRVYRYEWPTGDATLAIVKR